MSAIVGALRAILSLESAAFTSGLKQAQSGLKGFSNQAFKVGKTMQKAGVAMSDASAGFVLAIRGQLNAADDLGKAAQKFGVPVEQLSKLKYAADLSDVSLETLGTSLKKLAQGMSTNSKGFAEIGVQTRDASGALRDTESVLQDVSAVFASMPDGAEKTALAIKLFGKSGTDMIPLLNEGKAGLAAMSAEAEKLGIVIDAKTAKAAESFNDNLTRIAEAGKGLAMQITATLAPTLESLSGWMVDLVSGFGNLSPAMQKFTAYLAGAAVAGGPLLAGLGSIAVAIGAIATPVGLVLLGLTGLSVAIAWASWKYPAFAEAVTGAFEIMGGAVQGAFELIVIAIDTVIGSMKGLIELATLAGKAISEALTVSQADIDAMDFSGPVGIPGPGITGGPGGLADPATKAEIDAILKGGSGGSGSYSSGTTIGTALADGMADGFRNGMAARSGDIAATAGMADTIARDRLGVQSPSKVFRQIGGWLTEGLSLGMKDNVPMVGGAMDEIGAEIKTGADGLSAAVTSLTSEFKGLFGGIVTGAMSGREALASLASKLADMLADSAFDSLFGDGGAFGGVISSIAEAFGFAKGGVFSGGNVMAFANGGIVGGPTNFAMAGGKLGLMGEAGPEAIMPLTRGPGGKLGVQAHGGGGGTVRIIIEENPMFASRVQAISSDTAVQVVRGYDAEIAPISRARPGREKG